MKRMSEHTGLISSYQLLITAACTNTLWRHRMETFSALLAICAGNSPVTGEFPTQRSFDVFFDLGLNKRLSKQSWGWWFETPSGPLWRHCNVITGFWQQPDSFLFLRTIQYFYYPQTLRTIGVGGFVLWDISKRRNERLHSWITIHSTLSEWSIVSFNGGTCIVG